MIFVTIGTTMPFNDLIEAVDALVQVGKIPAPVICQIGNGTYVPEACEHFRFKPAIREQMDQADVIVSHGGTGSVFSLLQLGKPFVAVANPAADGDHQREFLERMHRETGLSWVGDLIDLEQAIVHAKPIRYEPQGAVLAASIVEDVLSAKRQP